MIRAVVRQPGPELANAELTHLARQPIDAAAAATQHQAYAAALTAAGVAVTVLPALPGHPDAAFVEDCALVLPELIVALRPGAASRRGEVASLMAALPDDRPRSALAAPATMDGGDVLAVGRTLFVGRSSRTNAEGVAALAAAVTRFGYRVVALEVVHSLHLKTAMTLLPDGRVLANPAWVDAAATGCPVLACDPAEPFGGNSLSIGGHTLYPAAQPRTAALLDAAGLTVVPVDIGEFARAEAGLTCLSVLVEG